ncbi:MAG: hypothetical protein ACREMY_25440 [bacterium]
MQFIPWIIAIVVATERLIHHGSRGRGSRWLSVAFLLSALGAISLLIAETHAELPMRVVLGIASILTALTSGVYVHPVINAPEIRQTEDHRG